MKNFCARHGKAVTGVLSCFDRLLFKGYLPISQPNAVEALLSRKGYLIRDFKKVALAQAELLKQHAEKAAKDAGRPYRYLNGYTRKEDLVREMIAKDGITEGLVCVLSSVEPCSTFRMVYGEGRPRLVPARRKCLCLYFYYLHRDFGQMFIRIQTWFPFVIQVCLNGHSWLARKMDKHGIGYRRLDNVFLQIEDPQRAQKYAARFGRMNWPRILASFARRVNPALKDLLAPHSYYWMTDQAEFATDVMFQNRASLRDLYPQLLKHATHAFSAEDVLTFLGRKLNGHFKGEVLSDYKKRLPGARVKHRMKENWIKMYDKQGCVLRIETVINRPYEFKVRRMGKRNGRQVMGWYPMAKRVSNLPRYAEVSLAANCRYLDALSVVADPGDAYRELHRHSRTTHIGPRSYRGFNPACPHDIALFAAVMRGEHSLLGFRNRHIRARLFPGPARAPSYRQSAKVSRSLKRLHAHHLIAKIPRSRRWRVTQRGYAIMSMALSLHDNLYPQTLLKHAA